MVTRAYFARRFLALKLLRGALVAGALYDAGLAALFLQRPRSAAALLGMSVSEPPPMAALAALWLAILAALGVAAARDTRRYSAVIAALIFSRAAAAVILAVGAGALVGVSPLPWAVAWSALLAAALAATWWPLRR